MATRKTDYTNAGQQRLLSLINLLAGHELEGLALGDIARAQGCHASAVVRDLDNLRTAGWAEQTPVGDRWRLSPHVIQISVRHAQALRAGKQKLDDVVQRFSRT